jgi:RNA polymerase Rpb1, domain 5
MLNKAVSGHQHHDTLLGEPGTQLTMRTFHIGGTASRVSQQSSLDAKDHGTVRFLNMLTVRAKSGDLVAMNRSGAAKAANRDLEAMETRQGAVRQAVRPGSAQRPGCPNSRERSWSLAHRQQPRTKLCAPKRLLRPAWCSKAVPWFVAQSVRTAGCGPACPVVWQGRRGDSPPYADFSSVHRLTDRVTGRVPHVRASAYMG